MFKFVLSILLLLLSLFLFLSSFFCYSPCEPVATDLYLTFIKQDLTNNALKFIIVIFLFYSWLAFVTFIGCLSLWSI